MQCHEGGMGYFGRFHYGLTVQPPATSQEGSAMQLKPVKFLVVLLSLGIGVSAHAQVIFENGFESTIEAVFPIVNGEFQLPAGPAVDQLNWVLGELSESSGGGAQPNTDLNDISNHFSSAWDPQAALDFINLLKVDYPGARIVDILTVTPVSVRAVIQSGDGTSGLGFLNMDVVWAENQKIGYFSVNGIGGSVLALQYLDDQNLTLSQAADKFQTISAANSILIARINSAGQCLTVEGREATTLRATASIFKIWVLGAIADMIASGSASPEQLVSLVASEVVAGSVLANIPLGTSFSVLDMATLMLGISDNTATDHLHELAGRTRLHQFIQNSGVADPDVLIPLLSLNEQFHLFYSVTLASAMSFINGTEQEQADYVENVLEPLGASFSYPYWNKQLLSTGSWQASPMDICQTFATLRQVPEGTPAKQVINRALGAESAQPFVRNNWDRVWYKGGSLAEATNTYHVYTHAWMLENQGEDAWAVIAMTNDPGGAIDLNSVYRIQSITSRVLQLIAQ